MSALYLQSSQEEFPHFIQVTSVYIGSPSNTYDAKLNSVKTDEIHRMFHCFFFFQRTYIPNNKRINKLTSLHC